MNAWNRLKLLAASAAVVGGLSACGQQEPAATDTTAPSADTYSAPVDMSTAPVTGMTPSTATSTTR